MKDIINKAKSGDQKTLLIIAGSLIVIALLSKILLILGIIIFTFVLYNMYKKKQGGKQWTKKQNYSKKSST